MKESSMYEYTNSAKDVRLFLVGEQCSEIIKSFTKFNFEHGVYQFFSEKLLEVAKSQYYIEFTEYDIKKFLTEKGVIENVPVFDNVEIEKDDYDKCEKIRVIGYKEYDSSNCVITDYYWFTLWEIAKTYNKKHGCVVIEPPISGMQYTGCGCFRIVLSWCKNANDAITHKLFAPKFNLKESARIPLLFFVLSSAVWVWVGLINVSNCEVYRYNALYELAVGLIGSIITAIILSFLMFGYFYKKEMKIASEPFERHCEMISKTEYSRIPGDVKTGDILFRRI